MRVFLGLLLLEVIEYNKLYSAIFYLPKKLILFTQFYDFFYCVIGKKKVTSQNIRLPRTIVLQTV